MEHKIKLKDVLIIILCVLMVAMGIGYSIMARNLVIKGYTKVSSSSSNSKLNVVITSIDVTDNKTEGTENKNAYVKNPFSAVFESTLSKPGDYIEYIVTIENKGSIDATLDYATLSPKESTYLEFERYGKALDFPELKVGESTTINIKVSFKDMDKLPKDLQHSAKTELLLGYVESVKQ